MSFFNELKRRNVIRVAIAYGVAAWFLLQLADLVLDNIAAPDWVMQVVMLVLAIGFPLVVIFAWAFEMTPEGIKKEKDVDRSQSITQQTGRKLDRAIIGILTVVVAYLLVDKLVLQDPVTESSEPAQTNIAAAEQTVESGLSVAVLPFVNMSGDKNNEYFSDGLTETLLHMLAQLPDLRVAARTSSFAFKGKNIAVDEIANTLGVAHILEGSVQKAGNRVRITAQLIRADDGFHVWSQNYDRTLEDIFAIQDEIAGDVAGALDSSLLGGGTGTIHGIETTNLTAYESFLKGLEQQAIFSYGSLESAENHFKQALARDPKFTDARLALVRNYLYQASTGLITSQYAREQSEPLILQVRQNHPQDHQARAYEIAFEIQDFNPSIQKEAMQAIIDELRILLPSIPTETFIRERLAGLLNSFLNDGESAIEVLQAGLLIDPLDANLHRQLGNIYRDLERPQAALAALQRAQQLAPGNPNIYGSLALLEKANNNLVAALEWRRRSTEVDPQDHELPAEIAIDLYRLDLPEEAEPWYARVVALAPGSAVARRVELERSLAKNQTSATLDLARSMIEDEVEDRMQAFLRAVSYHQDTMMNAGKSKEAFDFLVSLRPEITNYDVMPRNLHGTILQWSCINLMTGFEAKQTRQKAWEKLTGNLDKAGIPWRQPGSYAAFLDLVMRGDIEGAIRENLEVRLNRPLANHLDMVERGPEILLGEVYADPRIATRMAQLDVELQGLRREVSEMMLLPEWKQ